MGAWPEAITARSPLLIWPRVKAVWLLCGLLAMAGCGGSSTTGFSSNPNPPPPVAGLTLLSSSNGPDPGSWEALAFDGSQTVWMGVDRAGTASVGVGEYEVLNVTDERTTRELVLSGATFTSVVQQNGTGFVDAVGSYSTGPSSGDQPAIFLLAPIQLVLRAPVITPACPNDPMRTLLQQGAVFSGMALDGTVAYLGLQSATGPAAILLIDSASGNLDCNQVPIMVDGNPSDLPTDIKVSDSQIFVAVTSATGSNGGVEAFDKISHQKLWTQSVSPGFQGAALVLDETNHVVYAGGTLTAHQNTWTVAKLDFASGTPQTGWPVQPIAPQAPLTSDALSAMVANSGMGGGVIAVGCVTSKGSSDPNNLQPTIIGIGPDGKTLWTVQPSITGGLAGCLRTAGIGDNTLLVGGYSVPGPSVQQLLTARFSVQ